MDRRFGPTVEDQTTTFRLNAPSAESPSLFLDQCELIALQKQGDGFWSARVDGVGEGTRYKFRANGIDFPDLASRQQDGDSGR